MGEERWLKKVAQEMDELEEEENSLSISAMLSHNSTEMNSNEGINEAMI